LINEVRDPVEKFDAEAGMMKMVDPGVTDKRLMVIEPEFAGALLAADRHGNTLSPIIRKGWDGGRLATMTRSSPLKATNPHISIIGHITVQELRARLTRTDMANGFANRFLFMLVKRSRILPFGGVALELSELAADVHNAAEFAQRIGRVDWAAPARPEWVKVYTALSDGRPGLLGALTSRAEAQVVRLALIYAILDGSPEIDVQHLRAALAVWGYAEDSAAFIFGQSLGDPIADDILRALRQAGADGMSRTAIRDLFGRNRSADQIGTALAALATQGQAKGEMRTSGGRPAEVWVPTGSRR
jgi:hypothetical protein